MVEGFRFDSQFDIFYDSSLKEAWPDLATQWHRSYPFFDDIDLGLTEAQPRGHFPEWLAAVHCHHKWGVDVLLEKYQLKKHSDKVDVLEELAPGAGEFLRGLPGGPPDLLVYRPDRSDWWFVEVKQPRELLTKHQPNVFGQVRSKFERPIYKANVREVNRSSS